MNWIIGIAILVAVGYFVDREVYFYEGVRLGPRIQSWLYDRWAGKYDEGKRESQARDNQMLAQPILKATKDIPEPFILDFATGTGRLSFALTERPEFKGHIIALDLSQGMLEQAASKLSRHLDRVELIRHLALPLPFPDSSFDVVCALEVLELFPNMQEPLAEFTRVLRPGGLFVTSRGTEASGRKAKVKNTYDFGLLLFDHDFENFEISPWWKIFDRVIAVKNGSSNPTGNHKLQDVLKCSSCGATQWERTSADMKCQSCGRRLSITDKGILLN